MSNEFTIPGVNTDGLGTPPDVTFDIDDGGHLMVARPPGAFISINTEPAQGHLRVSRVRIVDTTDDVLVCDIDVRHVPDLQRPERNHPANYVADIACGLHWSM